MALAPANRVSSDEKRPIASGGRYVLYWQIAARRTRYNFALEHAIARAGELARPLVVLEALRCDYRWASDRLHRFVLQGMADNARAYAQARVAYYPYVEPKRGAGRGLLSALADQGCLVVTDEFPCFFLPQMVRAAAARLKIRLEVVDGNGLLPLSLPPAAFPTAYAFRRYLQRELPRHLGVTPMADPLSAYERKRPVAIAEEIVDRWPRATGALLTDAAALSSLPIDHGVRPSPIAGGPEEADARLEAFIDDRLDRYADGRNHPDDDLASGLSPYLHFGHLSAHEVFARVAAHERWKPQKLSAKADGRKQGWWGMRPSAESFLDEVITWRELGYVFCARRPDDYDQYSSLPDWARRSLDKHAADARKWTYSLAELEAARTHDPLWNAAQRQLVEEGRIHNYLRMVWGKKILEWGKTPRAALENLIELNNKYALDGRDPNSYSGIFWTLGRFDRPWAPERAIFGVIRYMSSENTAKKLHVKAYVRRFGQTATAAEGVLRSRPTGRRAR